MTRNPHRFFSLPLLPFVTALVAGGESVQAAFAISIVFFAFLFVSLARRWIGLSWKEMLAVVGCYVVAFFSVYFLIHPVFPKHHVTRYAGRKAWIIEGRILPPLDPGLNRSQVTVEARALLTHDQRRIPVRGRLRVSVAGPYDQTVYVGDRVRFVSAISRPRPPANPYGFDYRRFLALRGIYATARVGDFTQFVVLEDGSGISWRGRVDRLRQRLNRWITASVPAPYNALAAAFLIGYRGQVSPEMREIFVRCGASHLIAISGLHLGIVSILLFLIIRRLLSFFPRVFLYMDAQRITAVLTFLCLLFYLILTGGRVSTVRAFIMAAAFLAVLFFRRTSRLPDILLLAAFVILFFQPQAVYFVSFQLTFAAVAGILLGIGRGEAERFEEVEREERGMAGKAALWVGATLLITLLAMAATFPIATYHFHRASPMALVANLFGIPYVGFVMLPVGLISLILYPFSTTLATALLRFDGVLIEGLVRVFGFLARFPHSRVHVSPLRWYEMVFYYGIFVFTVLAFRSGNRAERRRYGLLAVGCAGFLIGSFWAFRVVAKPSIAVFSVRKGTYLVACRENGHAVVVCHGLGDSPRRDDARWVLLPYLLNKRIRELDALVVTNDMPVNLKTVAGILGYKHPSYLVGPRPVLYSLKSLLPLEDTRIRWKEAPAALSVGNARVWWKGRGPDLLALRLAGLDMAMGLSRKRRTLTFGEKHPDLLLISSRMKVPSPPPAVLPVRYPGMFPWYGRGAAKRGVDLRRDGAVVMERKGNRWRVTTFITHRSWWVEPSRP